MTKSKAKILILLTLVVFFLFSNIFIANKQSLEFNEKDQVQINQSGFWDLTGNSIYIDDLATGVGAYNWTWAETQPWCSGSGNWAYPYVIENVTIDGQGSGSCIEIRNSDAYFIIRNCSLYNSGSSSANAGITLYNVDNGKIINNNCSNNNWNGIHLYNSNNNTLSGNTANNNWEGVNLLSSDNNTISGNNASNNIGTGIFLNESNNNTLSGNTANNNRDGIFLLYSNSNTLSGNTANNNNRYGIFLYYSVYNILSGNLMNLCGIFLEGPLLELASHSIDNTNLVNNKPVYYYVNESGLGSSNFTDAGQIILINCSNSIISGFNLSNGTTGIYLYYSDNNTLSGNTASNNNYHGIYLGYSNNNTLLGNNASNNNDGGIYLYYSNDNTLSGNNANNNNGEGICLSFTKNNTLSGNLMNFCGIYLFGSLAEMTSHCIDNTNLVNNKPVYYYANKIGLELSNFTNAGQIILINCNNSIISGFNLSNGTTGIYLGYSNNNTLSGNTASNNNYHGICLYRSSNNNNLSGNTASNNNDYGIWLGSSNNNNLSGNNADNNYYGIWLGSSNNNNLSGNNADNNYYGIFLYNSDNNNLSGNNASNNNDHGIFLHNSDNNKFSGNTANNNNRYGIYLDWLCDKNTISGNTANNNTSGIYINWYCDNNTLSENTANNNTYGIFLKSNSNNNKIFLNNFTNNEINAEDNGINNTWDNGIIGNYWDDYAGVDINDDGIGDTPHIVPGTAGSQDNFPIWTDGDDIAPVITIIFPLPDSVFGLDAPNYNISIDELNLDTIWYTLDGGITNYTITDLTGTFNQLAWEALSEGNITIRFYANDTAGNIGFIDAEVIIEVPEDKDDLPIISFGNYYILFTFITITILSFIILEKRKKK